LTSAHIGAWLGPDGNLYRFFNGQIDEVAVYGTDIGFDRLAAHYQAALATIAPPRLNYSLQAGGLSLQWNGIGFVLQHNPDPSNPSGWSDVPSGNLSPVLVNPSLSQDFFRLRKP